MTQKTQDRILLTVHDLYHAGLSRRDAERMFRVAIDYALNQRGATNLAVRRGVMEKAMAQFAKVWNSLSNARNLHV